ncbi:MULTISPECIES: site-2 protease family protein [Caproicibacterium]|jgi:Zn-dependent protease|uniref:Site-2 protease family protein n=1 Tax=Caproicibacterium lactatifermentans TaxID=2666138 RepID=A0A859DQW8_9FIRM|nr:site-2 protease family protein [Caproicibacterium lactatifermentans]ARP50265.1 peptidase M50 [Ruminococcaceae bacterium CPB6]MDD4807863.1 site-2 protease family protein [Oscillospiraceae bacterium]QKN24014.1 site-2 protease family protein [Caproicibacterium lactatifermentans]QKO30915.1 site-2 protease family protein [Caproicibacterium lactatifermentans]
MLFNVIQSMIQGQGFNAMSAFADVVASILIIIFILPFHEYAHGWAAKKLGDPTAENAGRLTFNPLASLDPFGALFLILFGFGWAKPVPIDPRYFKNPKKDMALTAVAGPLANLLASLASGILFNVVLLVGGGSVTYGLYPENSIVQFFLLFFGACTTINISLAVFNLLPIPPLDGSRILGMFLSDRAMMAYYRYEKYIMFGIFALLLIGALDVPLNFLQRVFTFGIMSLANLPFRLLGV